MTNHLPPVVRFRQGSLSRRVALSAAVLTVLCLGGPAMASVEAGAQHCAVGLYLLGDGEHVDIAPSRPSHLRWRRTDGTTGELSLADDGLWRSTLGWTGRPDNTQLQIDCEAKRIRFDGLVGERVPLEVTDTKFVGAGAQLVGRLLLPPGVDPVPIVVLVHGAENTSARDFYALQRLFPAMGVGAFVYDKRGTGASGGRFTHDYLLLANDAIAAMVEAKRLAGVRAGRAGYQGASQGGWVAPLAARIEAVDFVIVSFGLAVSPLEEDREAVVFDMQRRGYGPDVIAHAVNVVDATAEVLRSDFREGFDQIEAVRQRYSAEPWFEHVRGNVTHFLLGTPEDVLREQGPVLLAGAPLDYDPMPVLRNLDVPQLWVLAEDDTDAPIGETSRRLNALSANGRPITTVIYPATDHGLYEYEMLEDGTRLSTRQPESYLPLMRDFIIGALPDR